LGVFCGTSWQEPPTDEFAPIMAGAGSLLYRAIELGGNPPAFAGKEGDAGAHSIAYHFLDSRTGGRLLAAPDVGEITPELRNAMANSDAVLFDGTFWSNEELSAVKPGARNAGDMGHVTIKESSMSILSGLAARHKIYVHINNTNPILAAHSPERAVVEAARIVVGVDGLEFEL
jgi:pyrroloquinoline quinone biosynthesis protein B